MGARVGDELQTSAASDGKAPRTRAANAHCARSSTRPATSSASADFPTARSSGSRSAPASRSAPFIPISTARRRCSRRSSATCRRRSATMSRPAFKDATDAIDGERRALESFLRFARKHRDVYRIIDEAEFVEPEAYREHYETTATRIAARLRGRATRARSRSDLSDDDLEILRLGIDGRERVPRACASRSGRAPIRARRRGDQPAAAQGSRRMNDAAAAQRYRGRIFHGPRRAEAPLSRLSRKRRQAARAVPSRPDPQRPGFCGACRALFAALPSARARVPRPRHERLRSRSQRATSR